MIDDHEITKKAIEQRTEILDAAEKYKKDISRLSQAYAREIKNREKLKQLKPKEKTSTFILWQYSELPLQGQHQARSLTNIM